MALTIKGKIAYSVTFLLAIPTGLIFWARTTASSVSMPVFGSIEAGAVVAVCGFVLMLTGMHNLWFYGGGLPMNAAPPPRFVSRGAYRLVPHPIYIGFVLISAGVSIWTRSSSGFWLVTPVTALCCASLVFGYEHLDLSRRFGETARPIVAVTGSATPELSVRVRCFLLAVFPWLIALVSEIAVNVDQSIQTRLKALVMVIFSSLPFLLRNQKSLRRFQLNSVCTMAAALAVYLATPMISWSIESMPSVPVACALLLVEVVASEVTALLWTLRLLVVCASMAAVQLAGTSYGPVIQALIAVGLGSNARRIWFALRLASERIANSWTEWRVGPVRIINHGLFAGAGGALTIGLGAVLAGPRSLTSLLFASCCAVIGAALWAQFVEGSPDLLRPFGFYGGLLGGTFGSMAAPFFHSSPLLILAVIAAGGMWAQALGRLRCLVQGCCHGAPSSPMLGIRYRHPRSRVVRFTLWKDVYLHPTPLYAILWNLFCGLLIVRLWTVHASLSIVIGLYFILSGIGRFAEEAWRGEPQTKVIHGLRLYQWASVASVVVGILFTAILPRVLAPEPSFRWAALLPSIAFGVIVAFSMGVDFPESERRFSRLC